jgi:general secretion pathway protein E
MDPRYRRRRIGDLLVSRGLVTERDRAAALTLQQEMGGLLGQLLTRIGAVSEGDLLRALSEQLGIPVLRADERPSASEIAALFAELRAPTAWWIDRGAVAWRIGGALGGAVVCAATQPLDPALRERLSQGVDQEVAYRLASRAEVAALLAELARGARETVETGGPLEAARLRELAQETPVVEFVNGLFSEALARRASDVHLEPFEDRFVVRLRIDGLLTTVRTGARAEFDAICSRIKLLSGMDIGERRLPQDGRQSIRAAGQDLDLRVSTLPSAWGESVVLRLLGKSHRLPQLTELGLGADQAADLLSLVAKPNGVVLVTGPTGSGKTTTIYRLLSHLNDGVRKIVTVEDPIEFDLPGVVQVRARTEIGLSFAAGLRAILRQDPDVIMVGEIRDPETARIAVQAALTGHLVISTVHTNTGLGAVTRLADLGVEDFLLADVLRGLVGQRLVRRLCPRCARPSTPAEAAAHDREIGGGASQAHWHEPIGCEACAGSGYLGRLGLYEIIRCDAALEGQIRDRATPAGLERTARANGFSSLIEDGHRKARAGLTTLAEVRRGVGAIEVVAAEEGG